MKRALIAYSLGALLLVDVNPVMAGGYRMPQGKGFSICEAFKRTLVKQGDLREPLACPNGLLDQTPGVSRPAWREVPFDLDLYLKLMALSASRSAGFADFNRQTATKPFDPARHPRFVEAHRLIVARNHFRMFVAELDTNGDGRTETVMRLSRAESDRCDWNGLFFVNPQLTDPDETPYWPTRPDTTMNTYGFSVDGATEIVLYAGKAFFFATPSPPTEFFFLRDDLVGRLAICKFVFTPSTQGARK